METEQLLQKISKEFEYSNGLLLDKTGKDRSTKTHQGYKQLYVGGRCFLVHRLIFLIHHGYFPKIVDHINGNKEDNRIENLQGCTQSLNISKANLFKTNKTGYKGVHYNKNADKYEGYFWKDYKKIYCGLHKTPEEAVEAREIEKRKYGK